MFRTSSDWTERVGILLRLLSYPIFYARSATECMQEIASSGKKERVAKQVDVDCWLVQLVGATKNKPDARMTWNENTDFPAYSDTSYSDTVWLQ